MATFITLIDYTDQGMRSIHEAPNRAEAFESAAKAVGVAVRGLYWTVGGHDGVLILEADDDKSVSSLLLDLGRAGNVRTITMRAYDRAEMQDVLRPR